MIENFCMWWALVRDWGWMCLIISTQSKPNNTFRCIRFSIDTATCSTWQILTLFIIALINVNLRQKKNITNSYKSVKKSTSPCRTWDCEYVTTRHHHRRLSALRPLNYVKSTTSPITVHKGNQPITGSRTRSTAKQTNNKYVNCCTLLQQGWLHGITHKLSWHLTLQSY